LAREGSFVSLASTSMQLNRRQVLGVLGTLAAGGAVHAGLRAALVTPAAAPPAGAPAGVVPPNGVARTPPGVMPGTAKSPVAAAPPPNAAPPPPERQPVITPVSDADVWRALSPFSIGSSIGFGWTVERARGIVDGAVLVELAQPSAGKTAEVRVYRNDGSPRGLAHTPELDLMLVRSDRGSGPTDEELGRAIQTLAGNLKGSSRHLKLAVFEPAESVLL